MFSGDTEMSHWEEFCKTRFLTYHIFYIYLQFLSKYKQQASRQQHKLMVHETLI